ncbi:ABC transporter permease [Bacillus sp. NP157]|nr:ABC transporter permease [Bacillus sp. NP157]
MRLLRGVLHKPLFLLLGAGTLALGVATFFATFAMLDALRFTAPAFDHHADVVLYGEMPRPAAARGISTQLYDAVGLPPGVLSRGLALAPERLGVEAMGRTALLRTQQIDAGFLPTLGVHPVAGHVRTELAGHPAALISWRLWRDWYGGAPDIVGRRVRVDGDALPVAGVLPEAYRLFDDVDVWLPMKAVAGPSARMANHMAVARLTPGMPPTSLEARMRSAAAGLRDAGRPAGAVDWLGITPVDTAMTSTAAPTLWFFLGCSALVLATACANLANLMLARALARGRETALRMVLGGGARHTWTPSTVDAAVVGIVAFVAGVLIGRGGVSLATGTLPARWLVNAGPLAIGWHVYAATAVVAAAATLAAEFGGTLHEHGDALLREHMGAGHPTPAAPVAQRMRVITVQLQLALATVLVAFCVVQVVRAWKLAGVPPGFDTQGAVYAPFRPYAGPGTGENPVTSTMQALADRAERIDRVADAGVATQLPAGTRFVVGFRGPRGTPVEVGFALHTPRARAALGLRLVAGRDLAAADTASAPAVVVVNQAFLAAMPGAGVGTLVRKTSRSLGDRDLRIVGVVADTRSEGPGRDPLPFAFVPFAQLPSAEYASYQPLLSYFLVARRTGGRPLAGVDLAMAVRDATPWMAMDRTRALVEAWHGVQADLARDTSLSAAFAVMGLGVGLVGLYSSQRVEVASRRRDLALRAALGATPLDLAGASLASGLSRSSAGIGLGLLVAFAWRRWLPGTFGDGGIFDLQAVLIATVAMLLLAGAVALPPALRGAAVDPRLVLRHD